VTASLEALAEIEAGDDVTLVHVPVGDIMAAVLDPPTFVVNPILPRGTVTLMGGHGGAGKSVLALTIAAHVAAGRRWAGMDVEQGRAIFASLEDPGSLVLFRLRRIVEAYGLNPKAIGDNMVILDGTAKDAALAVEFADMGNRRLLPTATLEDLDDIAAGSTLIVVDNASDAYAADENNRRQVRAFMQMLARLARKHDAAVTLLAHIDKSAARNGSQGNSYSGSTAWHNSARSRLALLPTDTGVELHQEKLNLGRPSEPITFRWSEHGVLVPAGSVSALLSDTGDAAAICAAMAAAKAAAVDVGAARTGPSTAQTVLSTFDELPERLRGPRGRKAFWSAMGKLQAAGTVIVADIKTASRHERRVLALAAGLELAQVEGARANSPHPYALNSAHEGARVCGSSRQFGDTEPAQTCAACDGEGCGYCRRAA